MKLLLWARINIICRWDVAQLCNMKSFSENGWNGGILSRSHVSSNYNPRPIHKCTQRKRMPCPSAMVVLTYILCWGWHCWDSPQRLDKRLFSSNCPSVCSIPLYSPQKTRQKPQERWRAGSGEILSLQQKPLATIIVNMHFYRILYLICS